VVFNGHGGRYIWRTGWPDLTKNHDLFTLDDLDNLQPTTRLPVVLSLTCYSAPFDHPLADSIGEKLLRIKEAFPTLKFITTHLGAWRLWDEAREYLIGREIYMEISFGLDELPPGQAREMIMAHPDGYILFGTDSPWTDQAKTLSLLKNLSLPEGKLKQVLAGNAASLLGTA